MQQQGPADPSLAKGEDKGSEQGSTRPSSDGSRSETIHGEEAGRREEQLSLPLTEEHSDPNSEPDPKTESPLEGGPFVSGRHPWRSSSEDPEELGENAKDSPRVSRKKDAAMGLSIICVAFVGCMLFSLWARDAALSKPAPPPGLPVKDLPGFPDEVRALELLPYARQMSVRALLQGFVAERVKPDGTLDFTKKKTSLRFSFQSAPGRGPQPPRQGGTLPVRTYCGRQSVVVGSKGMNTREDNPTVSCPRNDPRQLPVMSQCTLEDVWKTAKRHKFKRNRPARIEYYRSRSGPAYRFIKKNKKGKTRSLVVSARDCRRVLTGKEQRGGVP